MFTSCQAKWFLQWGIEAGFNNKILVYENGFNIGVNKLVKLVLVPTVSKTVSKKASKTASKEAPKAAFKSRLPHEERLLLQEHGDEMMAVSVLLIGTSLVFLYFFK